MNNRNYINHDSKTDKICQSQRPLNNVKEPNGKEGRDVFKEDLINKYKGSSSKSSKKKKIIPMVLPSMGPKTNIQTTKTKTFI